MRFEHHLLSFSFLGPIFATASFLKNVKMNISESGGGGVEDDVVLSSSDPDFCGYWNGSVEAKVGACSFWMEGILITITGN